MASLPAFDPRGSIPPAWAERFGPLVQVASHAGVHVLRLADATAEGLAFLKVHDESERGRREAALLGQALPVVTPRLVEVESTTAAQVVLGFDDARRGRDPSLRHLPAELLPAAAALLAHLHSHAPRVPAATDANGYARQLRGRIEAADLAPALREAFGRLVVIGDALCHHDLHPSNWLCEGGVPVGLLDWAAAGYGDPESDLAALVLAAGGAPARIAEVCDSWEQAAPRRKADRARVWLLLYLQLLEAARRKGSGAKAAALAAQAEALASGWATQPPLHGDERVQRVVPAPAEAHATTHAPGPLWEPVTSELARPVVQALSQVHSDVIIGTVFAFTRHACNDVLRVRFGSEHRVVKIYNKPVRPSLFELEVQLAAELANTPAVVLAPLRLDHGGRLFRVGCHLAAIYPYAGDERCQTTPADRRRLAAAQAALHSIPRAAERFPDLVASEHQLTWDYVEEVMAAIVDDATRSQMREVRRWAQASEDQIRSALPEALIHGSLHRDHAGWWPGRGVVLYDLEKVRIGPRLWDVVNTAYFLGYRDNDEQPDPAAMVHYLRAYHGRSRLDAPERAAIPTFLLWRFLHDVKALATDGQSPARLRHHITATLDFFHNRRGLAAAVEQYLE